VLSLREAGGLQLVANEQPEVPVKTSVAEVSFPVPIALMHSASITSYAARLR